jgi:hypothetical protein
MKKVFALFVLLLSIGLIASTTLESFTAVSDGSQVQLNWKTSVESNLHSFIIERKTVQGSYIQIAEISAKGSYSDYTFTDANLYKTTNTTLFKYKLKIVDNDGSVIDSKELPVSNTLSGIKRTWGSIKAMFR